MADSYERLLDASGLIHLVVVRFRDEDKYSFDTVTLCEFPTEELIYAGSRQGDLCFVCLHEVKMLASLRATGGAR